MDRTPADEEEMQRELSKLRRELRLKTPGATAFTPLDRPVERLASFLQVQV